MFCSNCGNQIPDDAAFCDKCGTKTQVAPIINYATTQEVSGYNLYENSRNIKKYDWINSYGKDSVLKETKIIKILSYVTLAVTCLSFLCFAIFYIRFMGRLALADVHVSGGFILLIGIGIEFALAMIFGIFGMLKYKTGFSITYLIFDVLAVGSSTAQTFGQPYNFIAIVLILIPLVFIIVNQVKITKKYKSNNVV